MASCFADAMIFSGVTAASKLIVTSWFFEACRYYLPGLFDLKAFPRFLRVPAVEKNLAGVSRNGPERSYRTFSHSKREGDNLTLCGIRRSRRLSGKPAE